MEKIVRISTYIIGLLAVVMLVQSITTKKFEVLRERNGYYSNDVVTIKTRERQ
jgi:hypothetical protein